MRSVKCVMMCGLALLAVGCSLDRISIIEHPDSVSPGETFQAKMASLYFYATPYEVVAQRVERDSLHFAIGTPEGWAVDEVQFYAAKDFRIAKIVGIEDSAALAQLLVDSLSRFEAMKEPMTPDESVFQALQGDTVQTRDTASDTSFNLIVDEIAQWESYSAEIDLVLEAGAPVDTFFADTSDSLGLTIIPIFVFAQLTASEQAGPADLYYYAKTGEMPANEVSDTTLDDGDMLWVPVNVGTTGIRYATGISSPGKMRAYPDPFRDAITLRSTTPFRHVAVFSLEGQLVKRLTPKDNLVVWNGVDMAGNPVNPGMYVVKGMNGNNIFTRTIRLVK